MTALRNRIVATLGAGLLVGTAAPVGQQAGAASERETA